MTINLPAVSKTTINGYLTGGMVLCAALLSQPNLLPQKYTVIIGGILTALRVITGHLQTDAGTTPALVLGSATPQLVPSHEIPDSAAAIPVKEGSGTVPTSTFPNK
jgi:hypothetical protein